MRTLLYDKDFLLKLDKCKNKTIYAKVTALKFDESPIETIEGRVTQGSINLDGSSAVRRTCSLTIVAQEFNYSDYYWGMNTKFKLEIGVENFIDPTYPNVIWFPQGIYLITGFNTSRSTNNFTISISGKDKMCLLNGEVSGSIESSVDFGAIEEEDANGVWTIRKIPIAEIIRNAVHNYGGEPFHNIIINDLDTYGLELLEYRYDIPMYLYREPNSNIFNNALIENKITKCYIQNEDGTFSTESYSLSEIPIENLDMLVEDAIGVSNPRLVKFDNDAREWIVAKIEYGQTAGYRETDLVYPGDLIANVGESLTNILDKIKNMLSEFEYFYDVDGRFVFQKKKSFINTMYSPIGKDEQGNAAVMESLALSSAIAYTFSGGELITAFNNNPNLLNMRNDYSIWGERIGTSGAAIPIHMRYAIDKKPIKYTSIEVSDDEVQPYNDKYGTTLKGQQSITYTSEIYDWRELIYQMALDYYKYNHLDDFEIKVRGVNPHFTSGRTGYEQYYIDMQGFWRELYYPDLDKKIETAENELDVLKSEIENYNKIIDNNRSFIADANNQLADLEDESQKEDIQKSIQEAYDVYSVAEGKLTIAEEKLTELLDVINNYENKRDDYYEGDSDRQYWNKNVFEKPYLLNFWIDFLDAEGELSQFNVKTVGDRSKAISESTIKSIYFRETPNVIFTSNITSQEYLPGYKYIQANVDSMFTISAQGKSAKDKLDELLYQHGYCVESATITAIPVYYLEPNTRIYLYDKDSGLDGEYIISKMTLPLTYNGTMSITATKAAESLF